MNNEILPVVVMGVIALVFLIYNAWLFKALVALSWCMVRITLSAGCLILLYCGYFVYFSLRELFTKLMKRSGA